MNEHRLDIEWKYASTPTHIEQHWDEHRASCLTCRVEEETRGLRGALAAAEKRLDLAMRVVEAAREDVDGVPYGQRKYSLAVEVRALDVGTTPPQAVDGLRQHDLTGALLAAVIAIWQHTEQHTTYIEGVGYTSRSDQQVCADPEEHSRLAAAEGKAWHEYRTLLGGTTPE